MTEQPDHVARASTIVAGTLIDAVQELSRAEDLDTILQIVRSRARELVGADGVSIILRDGDMCHYVDEDAIAPLWKGQRFPSDICVSGWVIHHRTAAVIPDIYADDRIPSDVYQPTFVRSLAVVPIRSIDPIGAIGAYWAEEHHADPVEVEVLSALASTVAVQLAHLALLDSLQQQVDDHTEQLRRTNHALEHFASVASHDLRSPLSIVSGMLETVTARPETPLSTRDLHLLERALAHTRSLSAMVDGLHRLARSQSVTLQPVEVDLDQVVQEVREALSDELATAEAVFELGPLAPVTADAALLRILLQNLVANGLKYADGDRRSTVHVAATRTPASWRLMVTDNGIGLAATDVEAIFELFTRQADQSVLDGAGIGLATCRAIAERHGGAIWAEPVDDGARFVVELPQPPATSDPSHG